MPMQADIMKSQAGALERWSDEWKREASNGVEGAAEVGWQLGKIAKTVRAIASGAPVPAGSDASDGIEALPPAAEGKLRSDAE